MSLYKNILCFINDYILSLPIIYNVIAPEESLQNLTVSNLNATSISVQWKRSDCIEENGVISNYNVTYYLDAYPEHSSTQSVSVRDITEFTATDLLPRSNYTFEINVISESGRGPTVKIFSTTNASEGWI